MLVMQGNLLVALDSYWASLAIRDCLARADLVNAGERETEGPHVQTFAAIASISIRKSGLAKAVTTASV